MAKFFFTGEPTQGQKSQKSQKSHENIGNPQYFQRHFHFLQFGPNQALYGITSMSHSYNRVNYGVSQLLTNVIKHMGITTTLAKCVTRCKHSICSLWHFLLCIFTTHPPHPPPYFIVLKLTLFFQKLGSGVSYNPLSYLA